LWAVGAAHAASVVGAVEWARRECDVRRARVLWLVAVAHAALGPVGSAGAMLANALGVYFDRHATPVDEWRRTLFPEAVEDPDAKLWALVDLRNTDRPTAIAPFVDVIEHGALAQKQAVVALIAKHFRPAFAPALRRALQDPQNAVRVQAATAVSLIEAAATSDALTLERQRRERPDDPSVLLQLARHEDSYAFTGLLDPNREQESRGRAIEAYRAYLTQCPDDTTALHELGRLCARLGRHAEALSCFEEVVAHDDSPTARLWIMECLFHLQRFGELRQRARESAALLSGKPGALPLETEQVLKLWAPGVARA
jgi:tetratricopeptide (TPR) repeat protein